MQQPRTESHGRGNHDDRRRDKRAQLRREALDMRRAGATYDEIAQHQGCTRSAAYKRVERAIAEIPAESAIIVRDIEVQRLDKMWAVAFAKATAGDVDYIDVCLRIMTRRAKMLGVDMPERSELTGRDGAPLALDATLAALPAPALLDVARRIIPELPAGTYRAHWEQLAQAIEGATA